jgi:hypothetical protein
MISIIFLVAIGAVLLDGVRQKQVVRYGDWILSSSSDPVALSIVDGTGPFLECGPHYSRRTPGSKTFTGVGREIVLVHKSRKAVWAVIHQRIPAIKGANKKSDSPDTRPYVWRNMVFRNLGAGLSSDLIRSAVSATYAAWIDRYGSLPEERLRTEINSAMVKSVNPGYCYKTAGWTLFKNVGVMVYLVAPDIDLGSLPKAVIEVYDD